MSLPLDPLPASVSKCESFPVSQGNTEESECSQGKARMLPVASSTYAKPDTPLPLKERARRRSALARLFSQRSGEREGLYELRDLCKESISCTGKVMRLMFPSPKSHVTRVGREKVVSLKDCVLVALWLLWP